MKKALIGLLVLVTTIAVLIALTGTDRPEELFTIKETVPGVKISRPSETYDEYRGQYKVTATVTNNSMEPFSELQLTTKLLDATGKEIASPIGGLKNAIQPGDSTTIETMWLIPDKNDLPEKVEMSLMN